MAGLRNLEHLAPSLYTGPTALLELVVDVRVNLREFSVDVVRLCEEIELHGLQVSSTALERYALLTSERCLEMLRPLKAPLRAKARLQLEVELQGFSRRMTSIVENFEFLVLSITARPIELDLKDVLSSRSDAYSARSRRPVPIGGAGLLELVSLPVHVVLQGLSLWYCSLQKEGVGLIAQRVSGSLEIRFAQLEEVETTAYFFNHTPSIVSKETLEIGFSRVGIECFEQGHALRLPLLAESALPR